MADGMGCQWDGGESLSYRDPALVQGTAGISHQLSSSSL